MLGLQKHTPRDLLVTAANTGLRVYVRDWGGPTVGEGGAPPVVLLHGLASTSRIFDLCAPLLAQGRRVISYDQRGHGESAKPDGGYRVETFVADGVGAVQALGLEPPYVVAGHSWGGSVALRWAAMHPEAVRAAVLVDGGLFPFREVPGATWEQTAARLAPPDLSALTLDSLLDRVREHLGFLEPHFLRAYVSAMMQVGTDGRVRARLSRERHLEIVRAMWEEDVDAVAATVQCPVLVLLAERESRDPEVTQHERARRALVDRLTAAQPLLTVRWLPDTIHDVPLQRPAVLAEAISAASESARGAPR